MTNTMEELCIEYENIITGRCKKYSSALFKNKSEREQEKTAIELLKVVFEKYLKWSPDRVKSDLNEEILTQMKLTPLLKYLRFNFSFNIKTDCKYIGFKLYEPRGEINEVDLARDMFDRVHGELPGKFPNKFFSDDYYGYFRSLFCLRYALNKHKTFKNAEEMYKFMYEEGANFLRENKLWLAFLSNYDKDTEGPVDFLNDALDEESQEKYKDIYLKYKEKEKIRRDKRTKKDAHK